MIIEGSLSVKAAIQGKKRQVEEIFIAKNKKDRDTSYIIKIAQDIKVTRLERILIDEMTKGKSHGGILARVSNRSYEDLEACFNDKPFIALIEGIEDPFNLGYIFRTLYSAGASGVIINDRNWESFEETILKSSAGAFDLINIYKTQDLSKAINECKKRGCRAYAAMRKDAIEYFKADFSGPLLIAIGGEMRGLSRDVLSNVDTNIFIPYGNNFKNALNAAGACAAISYEVLRQRSFK